MAKASCEKPYDCGPDSTPPPIWDNSWRERVAFCRLGATISEERQHYARRKQRLSAIRGGICGHALRTAVRMLEIRLVARRQPAHDRQLGFARAAHRHDSPFAVSRSREFGNKEILYLHAGPATAHLFIGNPFKGAGATIMILFPTHPTLDERVRRLREMRMG